MNLLTVNPWLLGLGVLTAILLLGVTAWTFRADRSKKSLPALVLISVITLAVAHLTVASAAAKELDEFRFQQTALARIFAAEMAASSHAQIRLDGSAKTAISRVTNQFSRWQDGTPTLVSLTTARKTPDGKMQVITASKGAQHQPGSTLTETSDTFADAWGGNVTFTEIDDRVTLVAAPIYNGKDAEGVLLMKVDRATWMGDSEAGQRGIVLMSALMIVLLFVGGVAGTELVHSLASLRVSRAEMLLQGERIKEQMDIIAEKNQQMAANQDLLAQANARLQSLATMDGLTGVMNHRTLMEFLGNHMKKNSVIGSPCSVVLLDVDSFKQLNDQYGHMAGDDALRTIAQVLRQSCPPGAGVGRYGGEEFMMVLPGASESTALGIAEELRRRIQMAKMTSRPCTASFGVSTVYSMGKSEQTLIDEADKAMYYSKTHGKNRVTHYGHGLLESA